MKRTLFIFIAAVIATFTCMQAKLIAITPLYRDGIERTTIKPNANDYQNLCITINTFDDAIMALRLAPELHAQGKTIAIQADPSLQLLLQMSPHLVPAESMPLDVHCCSLEELTYGHYQRIRTHTYAYLNLDPTLTELWHDAFANHTLCRVGLYLSEHTGTLSLLASQLKIADFMPFALFKHIELFTFNDVTHLDIKQHITVHYFKPHLRTQPHHIAAIINELDVLITSCPSMAALAWMLHKPVWLIQPDTTITATFNDYYPGVDCITYSKGDTYRVLSEIMERIAHLEIEPREKIVTPELPINELIDKLTMLEIKKDRADDAKKLANIWQELSSMRATFEQHIQQTPELEQLMHELKIANEAMWQTEERMREKEHERCFDDEFITLARALYTQNSKRCRVKRTINEYLDAQMY